MVAVDCARGNMASTDSLAEAEMPAVGKKIVRLGAQAVDVLGNVMQG